MGSDGESDEKQTLNIEVHSYLGFTHFPLTDIGSNGQNQQPTHFVYMNIITRVPYYFMELLYYSVYLQCTSIL